MITKQSVQDYLEIIGNSDAQTFLDNLGQDGVYTFYRTKLYKELPNKYLYAVYLVLLMNIKLNNELANTGITETHNIHNRVGKNKYTCMVTTDVDILSDGKDNWYEFLETLTRKTAYEWRGCIDKKDDLTGDMKDKSDMGNNVLTFRYYINRRKGHESVRLMIRTYVDEMLKLLKDERTTEKEEKEIRIALMSFITDVDTTKPWNSLMNRGRRIGVKWHGLTDSDKREIQDLVKRIHRELTK